MKKKILALAMCLIMVLSATLAGCGKPAVTEDPTQASTSDKTVIDNRKDKPDDETAAPAPAEVSDSDFSVKEYSYESYGTTYYFLAVTNNSKTAVSISSNGIAKDSDGGMIGADELSIDVLGPGETTLAYFYFDGVEGLASVDYELEYDTDPYYAPVIADLLMEQTLNDSNVTVKVTNNGSTCAEFVEAYALFFDADDHIVNHASTYVTDKDSEIKPGKSITEQLDCYDDYDHAEVYLIGRSTGETVSTDAATVSDDDFEFVKYTYSAYSSTKYILVITSHASVPVTITGNATAKDSDGNVLGADSMEINMVGPGETTIGYFYFDDVEDVADVEYELDYDTDPYYAPVLGSLSVEQTVNEGNVIVAVTNNGKVAAEFVEAHAIFFDADNNIVYTTSTYVNDDDSEIKPGKTIVEQLDCYDDFDHAEVYLTGRADK